MDAARNGLSDWRKSEAELGGDVNWRQIVAILKRENKDLGEFLRAEIDCVQAEHDKQTVASTAFVLYVAMREAIDPTHSIETDYFPNKI